VAATGRLSSSDPNLQNIPIRTELGHRIRNAFVADSGFSDRVSRLFADRAARAGAFFQDPAFLDAFASGQDIHRRTAAEVFNVALDAVSSEATAASPRPSTSAWFSGRRFGLAQPCASRAPTPTPTSNATSSAMHACASTWTRLSPRHDARARCSTCSAHPGAAARSSRAGPRNATTPSAWPATRPSRIGRRSAQAGHDSRGPRNGALPRRTPAAHRPRRTGLRGQDRRSRGFLRLGSRT